MDKDALTFTVVLEKDDLVRAFRLNARLKRAGPLFGAVAVLLVVLALILVLSPQARLAATGKPLLLVLEGAAGILLLLVLGLYAATPVLWRWAARRALARRGGIGGETTYVVTEQAVSRRAKGSEITEQFANLMHWREDDQVLLLFLPSGLFLILPKRHMDDRGIRVLKLWLEAAAVPQK